MNALLKIFQKIRAATETLCEPLKIEDYIPQPVDFASPPKWHLSHQPGFLKR